MTLEYVRNDGLGSPLANKADVLVFRAEVEATLSADTGDALWNGEVDDVGIYFQHAVRLNLIERMGDVRIDNQNERLVDQESGMKH